MDLKPLMDDLGIDQMPEEKQVEELTSLIRTINNRMTVRLAEVLTEEQLAKIEKVAAEGDDSTMEELEEAYPGFNKMYQEEIDKLREDFRVMRSVN